MKKSSLLLLIPLVCSISLVSCNNTSTTSSTPKPTSNDDYKPLITTPTTITLWSITGSNNQPQLESYIEDFKKLEPNVTVNNVYQTGMGYNELKTAVVNGFSGDNYPDIVQCYPDHVAEYITYNKAVNLDPYMESPEYGWTAAERADYIPSFLAEGTNYSIDGTYSVPYCKSTELMFYNEDVLHGLNLANIDATINGGNVLGSEYFDNLTWEELFGKLCPALLTYNESLPANQKILLPNAGHDDKYTVFAYDSDDNLFITLAEQYGYEYTGIDPATGKGKVLFNNDNMKNLMKDWRDYADKGYVISKGSSNNTYTNEYFTAKQTLFSVGSTGGVKYQFSDSNPMNVGVARIPHAEGKDPAVILQGPSLTVLNHDDENRALASWLLYKTITDEENSLDWAVNSGYMGVRQSNYESEEFQESVDVNGKGDKTLDRLMALSGAYVQEIINETFTSPTFPGSSTARTEVGGLMTKVLTPSQNIAELNTWFSTAENQTLLNIK